LWYLIYREIEVAELTKKMHRFAVREKKMQAAVRGVTESQGERWSRALSNKKKSSKFGGNAGAEAGGEA
jgi:hypothetical protein